jgi:hypothetical protein
MTLKRASIPLGPDAPQYFNPVFKAIGHALLDYINARIDSTEWTDELYVDERLHDDGVTDRDLLDFAAAYGRSVLAILAHAGVGKSTFAAHCIPMLEAAGFLVLKFDVLGRRAGKAALVSVDDLIVQFKAGVTQRLQHEMACRDIEWWEFVLEGWTDPQGRGPILLSQMRSNRLDEVFYKDLRDLVGAISFVDLTYLRLRYLRERCGRRPLIILDNVDRLEAQYQRELLNFAISVAAGSLCGDHPDFCPVLIALRPDTLEETGAGQHVATGLIRVERLAPPRMELVFTRRLESVLAKWRGSVVRGEPSPQFDRMSESEARDFIANWARAILTHEHSRGLVNDLHVQTGYNTRLSLVAIGNYLASGHQNMRREPDEERRALAYKTLLLGTRLWYKTGRSWAHNMFYDGYDDDLGALLTSRILKQFLVKPARQRDDVIASLDDLFGYNATRSRDRLRWLQALGLVEPKATSGYIITEPGRSYMQRTIKNFEYLQHVLIDTPVDKRYLVECLDARAENGVTRFRRVLAFARWVRELELMDYVTVVRNRREHEYAELYGDDTISENLAAVLTRKSGKVPGVDRHAELKQELASLVDGATLKAISAEAHRIVGAPIAAPARAQSPVA